MLYRMLKVIFVVAFLTSNYAMALSYAPGFLGNGIAIGGCFPSPGPFYRPMPLPLPFPHPGPGYFPRVGPVVMPAARHVFYQPHFAPRMPPFQPYIRPVGPGTPNVHPYWGGYNRTPGFNYMGVGI